MNTRINFTMLSTKGGEKNDKKINILILIDEEYCEDIIKMKFGFFLWSRYIKWRLKGKKEVTPT